MLRTERLIEYIESKLDPESADPWVKSRLAGLTAVAATTEFELSVKDIFFSFCGSTNPLFGDFVRNKYKNLRGRIKVEGIKDELLKHLGPAYSKRFDARLNRMVREAGEANSPNPVENYDTLIQNRHDFVHEGKLSLSFEDVCKYYRNGLRVMKALRESLADSE